MNARAQFWLMFLGVGAALSVGGVVLAKLLLPAPLSFFHAQFVSVALPKGWWCADQGGAFLCRHGKERETDAGTHQSRRAVIVFSAVPTTPIHTFEDLTIYLDTPKPIDTVEGRISSIVETGAHDRIINGRRWISATHMHSELPNYRTRYAVTITYEISVIVSFTVHHSFEAEFSNDFDIAMNNLELNIAPAESRP